MSGCERFRRSYQRTHKYITSLFNPSSHVKSTEILRMIPFYLFVLLISLSTCIHQVQSVDLRAYSRLSELTSSKRSSVAAATVSEGRATLSNFSKKSITGALASTFIIIFHAYVPPPPSFSYTRFLRSDPYFLFLSLSNLINPPSFGNHLIKLILSANHIMNSMCAKMVWIGE